MNKKWIYFIQLSNHMWDDGGRRQRFWYYEFDKTVYTPNNDVDFGLWDRVVKRASECGYNTLLIDLGDAIKYKSHPEIAAPDALEVEEVKDLLNNARALGFDLIPKLNFSANHHCWLKQYRRMVSSDIYRQVCVDLINEVCEIFDKPELFHLGMDEEHSFDCAQWRDIAVMRSPKLMFYDFNLFFDTVRKNGVRPWVWSDYYWNYPDEFLDYMPKDVLQSNAAYTRFKDFPKDSWLYQTIHTYETLDKAGYEQIATCSVCGCRQNAVETLVHLPKVTSENRLLGYCMAPWIRLYPENEHRLMDSVERLWYARKKICPETLN